MKRIAGSASKDGAQKNPHKPGWVESELRRLAEGSAPVSDRHFQILVAEALLMLLKERTK